MPAEGVRFGLPLRLRLRERHGTGNRARTGQWRLASAGILPREHRRPWERILAGRILTGKRCPAWERVPAVRGDLTSERRLVREWRRAREPVPTGERILAVGSGLTSERVLGRERTLVIRYGLTKERVLGRERTLVIRYGLTSERVLAKERVLGGKAPLAGERVLGGIAALAGERTRSGKGVLT
jgi:hypothetical protein